MYYEINVALHGIHFFATNERSLDSKSKAQAVYHVLNSKFPESAGYSILITKYETIGTKINPITFEPLTDKQRN